MRDIINKIKAESAARQDEMNSRLYEEMMEAIAKAVNTGAPVLIGNYIDVPIYVTTEGDK